MENENNSSKFKYEFKKRIYIYCLNVIKIVNYLDKKDPVIQVITRQFLRSATSIGANVIEAQSGRTKRDFTNYLCHALKSANETNFWFGLLRDSKKVDRDKIDCLIKETSEFAKILGSSILTLKRRKYF